jgi:hypothetical protein
MTDPAQLSPQTPLISDDFSASSPQDDQVLAETIAQAVPLAVQQNTDTLNPSYARPGAKETADATITLERPQFDQVPGIQMAEQEPMGELSPEVAAYLQKVETHPGQLPQQIVIADQSQPSPTTPYLKKTVIVLPITKETEQKSALKGTNFSIRWLVEFSRKVMRAFSGSVIYREQEKVN